MPVAVNSPSEATSCVRPDEDCSNTITVSVADVADPTGNCGWTWTRTYTIKDECGNTVTPAPKMKVSGSDQTAPAFKTTATWPEDIENLNSCFADADTTGLLDADEVAALYEDCSNSITVSVADVADPTGNCGWTWTRTYTIKDECGNTVTPAPKMSVSGSDQTAPAFKTTATWPDNITGQDACFADRDISGLLSDAAVKEMYEDCSEITVSHEDAETENSDCGWTITRTYTIKDACNNEADSRTMSVSGSDQTAPAFKTTASWPADIENLNSCFAEADTTGLKDADEIRNLRPSLHHWP